MAKYVASSGHKTRKNLPQIDTSLTPAWYSKVVPQKKSPSTHSTPRHKFLPCGAIAANIAAPVPAMRNLINIVHHSPTRCDSRSTAQSPFEIFEAGLPGSSLKSRGKEARPPPGVPGLGGAKQN